VNTYSKADLMVALERIEKEYPAVFRHFFLAELEKRNDSRTSDPGLGQEQETYQG